MPPVTNTDFLHGTLDVLILKTLSWGPRHGYAIARWLETGSRDALQIEDGSLYPALYRLERKKWIEAEWGVTETKRKAKFYRLSRTGRSHLQRQTAEWAAFSSAVSLILLPAAAPAS
jgi:PadR family transcriptional regulator PadR